MTSSSLKCPFCEFEDADEYFLVLHIEELHTEDSPFAVTDQAATSQDASQLHDSAAGRDEVVRDDQLEQYVDCPESECGEKILLSDLNEHLDFHLAERATLEEEQHGSSSLSSSLASDTMSSFTDYSPQNSDNNFSTSIHPNLRHPSESFKTPSKDRSKTPTTSSIHHAEKRLAKRSEKASAQKEAGRLGVSVRIVLDAIC